MASGYTHCACRDCFEVAVSDDTSKPELCDDCEQAGCDAEGDSECQSPHAYGGCDADDDDAGEEQDFDDHNFGEAAF